MSAELGARIALARERLKPVRSNARVYGQEDLARALGLTQGAIAAWERGEKFPKGQRLQALAEVLQVSLGWLLTGKQSAVDEGNALVEIPPASGKKRRTREAG